MDNVKKKHTPGLGGVSIFGDDDGPADLGHYVSPEPVKKVVPFRSAPAVEPEPSVPQPKAQEVQEPPSEAKPKKANKKVTQTPKAKPKKRAVRPPHRYVGTSKGTDNAIEVIVGHLRDGGPERNASASEFFQASARLVKRIAHAGKYSRLQLRGRWGSPAAETFVETLAGIYFDAIGEQYVKENYRKIREQVEQDIAREQADQS